MPDRLLSRQLVLAIAFKPCSRLTMAQTSLRIHAQRTEHLIYSLTIRLYPGAFHVSRPHQSRVPNNPGNKQVQRTAGRSESREQPIPPSLSSVRGSRFRNA